MGNEETPSVTVSYLSLIYDICLVRDRLAKIVDDLEDDALAFPDIPAENIRRVIVFLDHKLEERGIYNGKIPEASDIPGQYTPPEASVGP